MQSRRKLTYKRKAISKRKSYYSDPKVRMITPKAIAAVSDELKCHISLTDNMLYNNLTSKANVLVNWAGVANGTDTTFRLANSLEFTNN